MLLILALFHLISGIKYEIETGKEKISKNFDKLTSLSLKENGDYSKLKNLNLYKNELKAKELQTLHPLKTLEVLDFSYNDISGTFDLALLEPFTKLKQFWVTNNKIDKLKNSMTGNHNGLVDIILTGNQLTYVDLNVIKNFVKLKTLWLKRNPIVKIDGYESVKNHLPQINLIFIAGNSWVCSDLKKVVNVLKTNDIEWHVGLESKCQYGNKKSYEGLCCYPSGKDLMADAPEIYQKYSTYYKEN